MVSRFPDGSPIKIYGAMPAEGVLIATFNQDVTGDDLAGKLRAVAFYDGSTEVGTAVSNPLSSPFIQFPTLGSVGLIIRGNEIYASYIDDMAIFDLDYDGQHRKQFEQPDGTYIMMMPDLLLPREEGQEKKYLVVKVTTYDNAKSVACVVNTEDDEDGFQPNADNAELTDIDVDSWFTDEVGATNFDQIMALMDEILHMEYYSSLPLEFGEVPLDGQIAIDGQFNPFEDGSPYHPVAALQMTSRMPAGLPVEVSQGRRLLATFNRALTMQELDGKLNGVFAYESPAPATVAQLSSIQVTSPYEGVWRDVEGEQAVHLFIVGSNLYVETEGVNDGYIFDADYNQQHRRALTMQASPDPLLYYIDMPTLSPSILYDKICIYVYADDMNYFQLVKMPGSGDLAFYDGSHMPPQGIQADKQHLLSILMGVLKLEFSGSQDWDIDIMELSQDTTTMVGGVNLFEVSTMPAP